MIFLGTGQELNEWLMKEVAQMALRENLNDSLEGNLLSECTQDK
jgi:hypothetical protein